MLQIVLEKNAREAWYCNNSSVPLGIFRLLYLSLSATGDKPKNKNSDVFGERRVRRNSHSGTASAGTAWAHVPSDDRNLVPSNSPLAIWRGLQDSKIHLGLWGWKMDSSCFKLSWIALVWVLLSCKVRPIYSYIIIMYNCMFFVAILRLNVQTQGDSIHFGVTVQLHILLKMLLLLHCYSLLLYITDNSLICVCYYFILFRYYVIMSYTSFWHYVWSCYALVHVLWVYPPLSKNGKWRIYRDSLLIM